MSKEPITDTVTEILTATERATRKVRRLKQELFALFLMILGVVSVIDPNAVGLVFGPEARGWSLMVTAVAVYLLRVFTKEPAEKIWPQRKK